MRDARCVNLTGVPETMLWTLHNRANEVMRRDSFLHDPECLRIYRSIDYDYGRSFGKPDGSHPMRSKVCDDVVRSWMQAHAGATVVELGCGLETQFQRCDDGKVRWLCVDLPEAIAVRERFLAPSARCRHIPRSALDRAWMHEVDKKSPVFVTAQGLLMYFDERAVRQVLAEIMDSFPGVELIFDTIPRWFARKTLKGFGKTKHYIAPPMPWGINQNEIRPTLRSWSSRVTEVHLVSYGYCRGLYGLLRRCSTHIPLLRNMLPCIVHVRTAGGEDDPSGGSACRWMRSGAACPDRPSIPN